MQAIHVIGALLVATSLLFVTSSAADHCIGNITVGPDQTIISSDNFPSNYADYTFCRYYITGPEKSILRLNFTNTFDIEVTPFTWIDQLLGRRPCSRDNLVVYDTAKTSTGVLDALNKNLPCRPSSITGLAPFITAGPFCGLKRPEPINLRSNVAVIDFCTDHEVTGMGWQISLEYTDLSGEPSPAPWVIEETVLEAVTDVKSIKSPNFPANYFDDYNAQYTIRNRNRNWTVVLRADIFDLGKGCDDVLVITDVTNNVTYRYCDRLHTYEHSTTEFIHLEISNSEEIHVNFTTDKFDNHQGFSIEVSVLPCPSNLFACDDGNGCYHPNSSCNGVSQCQDGSDEKWNYCAPECGASHIPVKERGLNRIVGGVLANRHSLPWQAALIIDRNDGSEGQFCGGSIISDRWLMSAAHCFTEIPNHNNPMRLHARLGGYDLSRSTDMDAAVKIEFERIICHPYYNNADKDYDYCLIKLKKTIPFRKNIAPVCLPPQGADVTPGTFCLTSGFGTRFAGAEETSRHLRQVYIPVVSREICASSYPGKIKQRMLCGGTVEGGVDSCQGDSGGPFVCQAKDGRWTAQGIVSFGKGCGIPDVPGVYARTGALTHWIIDVIATN